MEIWTGERVSQRLSTAIQQAIPESRIYDHDGIMELVSKTGRFSLMSHAGLTYAAPQQFDGKYYIVDLDSRRVSDTYLENQRVFGFFTKSVRRQHHTRFTSYTLLRLDAGFRVLYEIASFTETEAVYQPKPDLYYHSFTDEHQFNRQKFADELLRASGFSTEVRQPLASPAQFFEGVVWERRLLDDKHPTITYLQYHSQGVWGLAEEWGDTINQESGE